MNALTLKPLAAALATTLLLGNAMAAEVQPRLKEEVSVMPGRVIAPADEAVLSAAAQRVLRHVSSARAAIAGKDAERAGQELEQAETLLDVIRDNAPTTVVRERILGADSKVRYENSEEVGPAVIPIYSLLGEEEDFDRARLPASGSGAKPEAKAQAKAAPSELEARDTVLYYEELDLPLNAARHWVVAARSALGRKDFTRADAALRAVQDSVDFAGVYLPAPLVTAKVNLERAHDHYNAGKTPEARADLARAIVQLKAAESQSDPDSKADAQKLLADAQALQKRMDGGEAGLAGELKRVWRHTEALADRAVESTAVGWARLRHHGALRADVIEAKRYVAYADIDANVAQDGAEARADLEKAKGFLDQAMTAAAGKTGAEVAIKDARAVVDTVLTGQARTDPGELANLKRQLGQIIQTL